MKATFLTIADKAKLIERLNSGDKIATEFAINEIERLESLVRDYEVSFESITHRIESKSFKTPIKIFS